MTTQQLLTVTLSTGETVLAKSATEPLRYGNLSAAEKKLSLIEPLISPARSASIVKQDGRFLILVYDAPGYQSISLNSIERMLLSRQPKSTQGTQGPGYVFATTSGKRQNLRNRHNHNHANQTDKPYYFGG